MLNDNVVVLRPRLSPIWSLAAIFPLLLLFGCSSTSGGKKRFADKICKPSQATKSQKALAPDKPALPAKQAGTKKTSLAAWPSDRKLDKIIAGEFARRHIPGGAAAIISEGKFLYAKNYGLANITTKEPVTSDTRFWIGSITKQFTAMAVMMLVEQGRVNLDSKLSDYLPKIPQSYDKVTVRHMLTHTSGIKRQFKRKSCPPYSWELLTGDPLFEALQRTPLQFKPGSKLKYSNMAYVLLGMMIEAVSGTPYMSFLKTHIFDPLSMTATRTVEPNAALPQRLAAGHKWRNMRHSTYPPSLTFAAGTLVSTISDMAKWDAALYTDRLVSKATLIQIWKPYKFKNKKAASFGYDERGIHYKAGFGWAVHDEPGNLVVHHGGYLDGNGAFFSRSVSKKLTFIVFINHGKSQMARGIANALAFHYEYYRKSPTSE